MNAIHTLHSGKEINKQVRMPVKPDTSPHLTQSYIPKSIQNHNSDISSSSLDQSKEKDSEPIPSKYNQELAASFPNRLRNIKQLP